MDGLSADEIKRQALRWVQLKSLAHESRAEDEVAEAERYEVEANQITQRLHGYGISLLDLLGPTSLEYEGGAVPASRSGEA